MRFIIWLGVWLLLGLWSYVITQNIIGGWGYVRKQDHPILLFGSSMIMGSITTLFCLYTLFRHYKSKGGKK